MFSGPVNGIYYVRITTLKGKNMTQQEREELINEKRVITQRLQNARFASPADFRRIDIITSLLLTDGESECVRIVQVRKGSRSGTKGLNNKKQYSRKGPVG